MIHKGLTQELGNWRNTMFFKVKDGNPSGCCFRIHEYPNESGYYISCNDWDITEQIEVYVKKHRKYKMWIITLKDKNINTVEKFKTAYGIQNTNSQKQKISGVVYDENKKRIPNVFISNLNRKESYITDSDGKYLFTAQENDILVFYLDGFKSKTAKVKGPNLDVFLETNLKKKN